MKQKTRILIYILIAAAAVIIGVIAVFSKAGGGESAAGHIDLGRTYLIELSYDKAVIEFTEAIRIDPMNVDAYLGLAEAYLSMGKTDEAVETLKLGYEKTGDIKLKNMIDEIFPVETTITTVETISVSTTAETEIKTETIEEENIYKVSSARYTYAALLNDGSLYMWGDNSEGQLGIGHETYSDNSLFYDDTHPTYRNEATQTDITYLNEYTPVKIMDNVIDVSLGGRHSAAVTENGDLYTWGINDHGELGNGSTEYSFSPTLIMKNIASVNVENCISAAITGDGELYMWGDNAYNKLNLDSYTPPSNSPVPAETTADVNRGDGDYYSSVPVKIMDNAASVCATISNVAVITKNGELYMWGSNYYGQLGEYSGEDTSVPQKIMDNVESVSLGDRNVAAVTSDGTMYVWGHDFFADSYFDSKINTPEKFFDNVKKVSLGMDSDNPCNALITTDGELYMWGDNRYGQFGDRKYGENSDVPVKVMENVVDVDNGFFETVVLKENGEVYRFGGIFDDDEIGSTSFKMDF